MTLCRTGSRSINAGNILADPENQGVPGGVPFTNARNNWDGFVGQYRYAFIGGVPDPNLPLDLDNNGLIDEDYADLFPDTNPSTTDANADKDGWRGFQGLPWTAHIRRRLAYLEDPSLYYEHQYGQEPPPKRTGRKPH